MTTLQLVLEATLFRKLIIQSIPVNKTRVETEKILWHKRLGHPCDEYYTLLTNSLIVFPSLNNNLMSRQSAPHVLKQK